MFDSVRSGWSTHKKLMFLKAAAAVPAVEDTATGNPVTFLTDLAKPLKQLKVNFTPKQASGIPSLENRLPITGWDAVNVNHAGKNWFDENVNQSFTQYKRIDLANPIPAGTYVFTATVEGTTESSYVSVAFAKEHNVLLAKESINNHERGSVTFTVADEVNIIYLYADIGYAEGAGKDITYSGIMITEQVPSVYPVVFPAVGKNLVPQFVTEEKTSTGLTITPKTDGFVRVHGKSTSEVYTLISRVFLPQGQYALKAGTYTFRINTDAQTSNLYAQAVLSNGTVFFSDRYGETKTIPDCYISRVDIGVAPSAYNIDIDETISPQLEAGSTPTAYEPYTNTVFGGYYNLITGELWATWTNEEFDGSQDELWDKISGGSASAFAMYIQIAGKSTNADSYMCDSLQNIPRSATWGNYDNWISDNQSSIVTGVKAVTTVADWRTYLSEHPINICYKLAEPVLIATLTPQQINAIKNQTNTIWSDANGNCEVTYLKKG